MNLITSSIFWAVADWKFISSSDRLHCPFMVLEKAKRLQCALKIVGTKLLAYYPGVIQNLDFLRPSMNKKMGASYWICCELSSMSFHFAIIFSCLFEKCTTECIRLSLMARFNYYVYETILRLSLSSSKTWYYYNIIYIRPEIKKTGVFES